MKNINRITYFLGAVLAAATLEEMGVKNVLHLEGGFGQWKKAGGPKADKPSHKDKA